MSRVGLLALAVVAGSCMLGPNYQRPTTPMTPTFRGQDQAEAASFADLPWWQVLRDPALNALITEGLRSSYDLQDAIARVEVARQNANVSTDVLLPAIGIQAGPSYQQIFSGISIPGAPNVNHRYAAFQLQGTLRWELDLWGRLRRLQESAVAQFLASEDNRRAVVVSLIGEIAQNYFDLLALDLQLEVTRRTVATRQETLLLFQQREAGGVGDALDTTSEEALLASARAAVPDLERRIMQTENQIGLLIGRPPGAIRRNPDLLRQAAPLDQPVGLPAALLERRPDVRQAEALLVAANAEVGAAYAAMFPTLSLNATGGVQSTGVGDLFTTNALTFGIVPLANWVALIFNGAQYLHTYHGQQASYVAALANYRRTVLGALADVSNALIAIKGYREARVHQETEVRAQTERVRLAKVRFTNGVASYLDVVQAEQNLFLAELSLAQTIAAQFSSRTQLYRALGGGWQVAPPQGVSGESPPRAGSAGPAPPPNPATPRI